MLEMFYGSYVLGWFRFRAGMKYILDRDLGGGDTIENNYNKIWQRR